VLYDATATLFDLAQVTLDMAVIPIGAIEQHSGHLPLGTDWLAAQALARRVAERLAQEREVYLAPALPFSLSQCHGPVPGTVWLKPTTLAQVVREAVLALYGQGLRHVLVINGHGGNFVIDSELQELNLAYPDLIALNADWLREPGAAAPSGRVTGGDIHAGAGETSLLLHLHPELVRPGGIDAEPQVGREFFDYLYLPRLSPAGVWGRPSRASAQAGRQTLERDAERIASLALKAFAEIAALRAGEKPR
jgi:creatinine amidohydrolase